MADDVRRNLVAPCGIDCGACEIYLSRFDKTLKQFLISRGISEERIPCDGCRAIEGSCPVIENKCQTYECVKQHNVTFCHECEKFPCGKLNPAADRADILPHNLKVYNLSVIRQRGVDKFIEETPEIRKKYYKGTMKIGQGPDIEPTKEHSSKQTQS